MVMPAYRRFVPPLMFGGQLALLSYGVSGRQSASLDARHLPHSPFSAPVGASLDSRNACQRSLKGDGSSHSQVI
jgi:hypothetical protein